MKLGINATFLSERLTGLGIFTTEVSRRLAALTDSVVYSPVSIAGVPSHMMERTPRAARGSLRFRHNFLRACYINTLLPLRCRQQGVDLLFNPMVEHPLTSRMPQVVQIHDLHPIRFPEQFGKAALYFRLSLKRLERGSGRLTVVSEFVKGELLKETAIASERIDVVLNGYDSALFTPRDRSSRDVFMKAHQIPGDYILFIGNLFPYKNVPLLIEAFRKVRTETSHALVIIGRRAYSPFPMPADDRIIYIDYVPAEDLPDFYSYADLLVHPSLSEGFGLTPLEAMACGTPVLASNRTAIPEVVGDAGILFDPGDPEELSRLMLDILGSSTKRAELSARGIARARQFSWEKTAAGIYKACERALV